MGRLLRDTASGLPLRVSERTHYSESKLGFPAGQSWGLLMPQPSRTHRLLVSNNPGTSAPLQRGGLSHMQNHLPTAPICGILMRCQLDGPQPPPTRYCFVIDVTVHGLLLHLGIVLCLYVLESLIPLDFSVYPGALAHTYKTRLVFLTKQSAGPSGTPAKIFRLWSEQWPLWLMQKYFQPLNFSCSFEFVRMC